MTDSEIHIAVVADVDNSLAPGLFKGAVDGTKAGAKYVNSKAGGGGVAGRKLVVDFYDSKLNPNETRNAVIKACQNDIALVGGLVLFLTNIEDLSACTDQAGKPTGLPDMPASTVSAQEACSLLAYPVLGGFTDCAKINDDPQTYYTNKGSYDWLVTKAKKDKLGSLHGPRFLGNDTKDAVRGSTVLGAGPVAAGIKPQPEAMVGRSARDPQSAYTGDVQQMKANDANFVLSTMGVSATQALLQEAKLQGVDTTKMMWTNVTAYGASAVTDSPDAWEGMYQPLNVLPFEETSSNKTLAAFVKNVKSAGGTLDTFAAYGFEAVLAFRDAANAAVEKNGVNGLTRANLVEGLKTLTDFNADGMAGTHSFKDGKITGCFVLVRFLDGKWVRQYPTKKGTFDCKPSNLVDVKLSLNN